MDTKSILKQIADIQKASFSMAFGTFSKVSEGGEKMTILNPPTTSKIPKYNPQAN